MGKYTVALSPQSRLELLAIHKHGNKALIKKAPRYFKWVSQN